MAIGPGIHVDSAIDLARAFDRDRPEVVVVIVAEPTADLWAQAVRSGVRDVVAPNAVGEELRASFDHALETAASRRGRLAADPETRQPTTRIVTVISPKGGSGKTTVATNLAVGLAQVAPHQVVLIDLDLQFGDVASALRLTPEHTIADTARTGVLDTTTLKVLLTPHPAELFTLCAPESLAQADDLDPEQLSQVVRPLSTEFKYIVIDTCAGIDAHALAAMELATDLIMVCTTDVPCVRGVRKAVEALDVIGLSTQTRHFVLNRADARVGLERERHRRDTWDEDRRERAELAGDVALVEQRDANPRIRRGFAGGPGDDRAGPPLQRRQRRPCDGDRWVAVVVAGGRPRGDEAQPATQAGRHRAADGAGRRRRLEARAIRSGDSLGRAAPSPRTRSAASRRASRTPCSTASERGSTTPR